MDWVERIAFVGFALLLAWYCLAFVDRLNPSDSGLEAALASDRTSILLLTALLLCLTPWTSRASPLWSSLAVGSLVGALIHFRQFGWAWLDPGQIEWLLHGDVAQHYLGWAQFRQESWHWPPGVIEGMRHPVGTSVFFTDSMPLLALVLKPLSSLLPTPFQYIGLIYLGNWILMGAVTAATVRIASDRLVVQGLAALLIVLAPALLLRISHDTLTSQWLIVAAIGLTLWRNQTLPRRRPALLPWALLVFTAALTHLYLLAMVSAVLFADWLQATLRDRAWPVVPALVWLSGLGLIALGCLWLAGAFTIPSSDALDRGNAGRWSADLLSLFDPGWSSRWINALGTANPDQWEGSAYLGTGAWIAVLSGLLAMILVPASRELFRGSAILWLFGLAMLIFALGTPITFAGQPWLQIDALKSFPAYSVFRACGRFIWVAHYLLLVAGVLALARAGRWPAMAGLALACMIQVTDSRVTDVIGERRSKPSTFTELRLGDEQWHSLARDRRHLSLVPAVGCGPEVVPWLPITELAVRLGLYVNSGYLARVDGAAWQQYCLAQARDIERGETRADTIYVVHSDWLKDFQASAIGSMNCRPLDGLNVCVTNPKPQSSGTSSGQDQRIVTSLETVDAR